MNDNIMFEYDGYQYIYSLLYNNHVIKIVELDINKNKRQELILEFNKNYIISINNLENRKLNLDDEICFNFKIDNNNLLYSVFLCFLGNKRSIIIQDRYMRQKYLIIEISRESINIKLVNCYLSDDYANTTIQVLDSDSNKIGELYNKIYNTIVDYNRINSYQKKHHL